MEFGIDFFRDEVRNGFYIPAAIKQAWAATLDVLSEIDRICVKYDITYFADWGTFLGAVRHGGFIPWDDDLDICMKRDDYVRFREVADSELPAGFVFHDYERKDTHWEFLARVVNNDKMCFDEEYLRTHNNFPWLAGVDIFVKDYLYSDNELEKERDDEVMHIYSVSQAYVDGDPDRPSVKAELDAIRKKYNADIPDNGDRNETAVALYKIAEKQMARVKGCDTNRIGQIFPWILKAGPEGGEDKEWYDTVIRLPFENTTVPVPAFYNRVLSRRYKNFNEIRKVWDGHGYPFFEGQRKEMEQLMGGKMPGFSFDRRLLMRPRVDRSGSLKTISAECIGSIRELINETREYLCRSDTEKVLQLLADAQQLATDLGTLTEAVKGADNPRAVNVVKTLEDLCERIFETYEAVSNGAVTLPEHISAAVGALENALAATEKAVEYNILKVREILFLPIGSSEWKGFEDAFRFEATQPDTEISIVPLPLLKKDYFGNILMTDEEINRAAECERYPEELPLADWMTYDIALHCPDRIYIQSPYDETNPVLTVPQDFYTVNLRKYSEEIIFIPFKPTYEFGAEDINDLYNMKHYVAAPGVICADRVIVQSENIRERYIECLTDFANKDTEAIWEEKITVAASPADKSNNKSDKSSAKKMIFCIGANELKEHPDAIVSSVRERLGVFKENSDRIKVSLVFYPGDRKAWEQVDEDLSNSIFAEVESSGFDMIEVRPAGADDVAEEYDAYYGSSSPLVPAFSVKHKPVMIADFEINY